MVYNDDNFIEELYKKRFNDTDNSFIENFTEQELEQYKMYIEVYTCGKVKEYKKMEIEFFKLKELLHKAKMETYSFNGSAMPPSPDKIKPTVLMKNEEILVSKKK